MKARLACLCIALTAVAAGCNEKAHSTPPRSYGSPAPPPKVIVSRDDGSLPRRCGVARTATRVAAFLDAVNRGDAPLLERLIADRNHFQWYSFSVEGGKRFRAFNSTGLTSAVDAEGSGPLRHVDGRPVLLRYLARRSRAGVRMRLRELHVTRIAPREWFPRITDEVAGVDFKVRIDAPDLAALPGRNRLAGGKGAFGCTDGRLLAWTMGLNTIDGREIRVGVTCPAARRKVRTYSGNTVVACSGY